MLRKPRTAFFLILVAVATSVSVAAVLPWIHDRLPDPAAAEGEGLIRWLVTRELTEEPAEVRAALVRRLEQELKNGIDLDRVESAIDEERRQRFWSNVDVLLEEWFVGEAESFAAKEVAQQNSYVSQRIDDVLSWKFVEQYRAGYHEGERAGGDGALLGACNSKVTAWIATSDEPRAKKMTRFLEAVRMNLFSRYFSGTLPPVETAEGDTPKSSRLGTTSAVRLSRSDQASNVGSS